MNVLELNRPAISGKLSLKETSVRPYIAQMQYMTEKRIVLQASPETPVYRIAKDYEIDGVSFALNLIITDNNVGKAEKFLDKVAKKVSGQQAVQAPRKLFSYLDERYKV